MDNFQLRVTDEQVAAAQLRAVLDEKLGRRTPELVRRIAVMTGGSERAEGEATSSHPVSSTPSVSAATEPTHQASRPYQGDCGEVLAEVWLFLDNEDDHEWSEVLKRHLDDGTCLEAFGLAEDVRALLASEDGGGQASDALRKRLRQSIKEIVTREAMTRAEVVVQQDDRGTFLDVRTSGVESRVGRVPPEASKDVWGQRLVPRARTGTRLRTRETARGGGQVVQREKRDAEPMSVEQAVAAMEVSGQDFYLFSDESSGGRPSVLYRRDEFAYGVIQLGEDL